MKEKCVFNSLRRPVVKSSKIMDIRHMSIHFGGSEGDRVTSGVPPW